jgi:archaellum component FlaF (FlaF/FlaG flagellin family)
MAEIHYVPSLILLLILIIVGYNYSSLNSQYDDLRVRYNSLSSEYNMLENRFLYVNSSLSNSQRMLRRSPDKNVVQLNLNCGGPAGK